MYLRSKVKNHVNPTHQPIQKISVAHITLNKFKRFIINQMLNIRQAPRREIIKTKNSVTITHILITKMRPHEPTATRHKQLHFLVTSSNLKQYSLGCFLKCSY